MIDIWSEVGDQIVPFPIQGELIRVVESQEQIATNSLVNTFAEQDALETMLEATKPPFPAGLHYLLATPFRYPPLAHGSRFGGRFEPSLFYASQTLTTAFAETGYYRLLFWRGMRVPPPSGKYVTQHSVFGVPYDTSNGLKLQDGPLKLYEKSLTSPSEYTVTQKLGTAMRDAGIEAFEYISARDLDRGINVALFTPDALGASTPTYQAPWLCQTSGAAVSFYTKTDGRVYEYVVDNYLVDGVFPEPAV